MNNAVTSSENALITTSANNALHRDVINFSKTKRCDISKQEATLLRRAQRVRRA